MFDMGFFELLVIAVVGLLVIGPERFPGAVRACGLWIGRMKRVLRETRTSLELAKADLSVCMNSCKINSR